MTAYWAGKQRIGKDLSKVMLQYIDLFAQCGITFRGYWECFVGMGGVMRHMIGPLASQFPNMQFCGTDNNVAVTNFWSAIRSGWEPPSHITPEQYQYLKDTREAKSALHAFVGYSCGFHSEYFKGCPPPERIALYLYRNHKNVRAIQPMMSLANYANRDFFAIAPYLPHGFIYYLDPPYKMSGKYDRGFMYQAGFDTDKFWRTATALAQHSLVFVSETEAPDDWVVVWEKTWNAVANEHNYQRVERLFMHQSALRRARECMMMQQQQSQME